MLPLSLRDLLSTKSRRVPKVKQRSNVRKDRLEADNHTDLAGFFRDGITYTVTFADLGQCTIPTTETALNVLDKLPSSLKAPNEKLERPTTKRKAKATEQTDPDLDDPEAVEHNVPIAARSVEAVLVVTARAQLRCMDGRQVVLEPGDRVDEVHIFDHNDGMCSDNNKLQSLADIAQAWLLFVIRITTTVPSSKLTLSTLPRSTRKAETWIRRLLSANHGQRRAVECRFSSRSRRISRHLAAC